MSDLECQPGLSISLSDIYTSQTHRCIVSLEMNDYLCMMANIVLITHIAINQRCDAMFCSPLAEGILAEGETSKLGGTM